MLFMKPFLQQFNIRYFSIFSMIRFDYFFNLFDEVKQFLKFRWLIAPRSTLSIMTFVKFCKRGNLCIRYSLWANLRSVLTVLLPIIKWLIEQHERIIHCKKSVAKQKYFMFSRICHSVVGQKFLTNVDTAGKLWLEYSQSLWVWSQWT